MILIRVHLRLAGACGGNRPQEGAAGIISQPQRKPLLGTSSGAWPIEQQQGIPTSHQAQELAAWMAENNFGPEALESIKTILVGHTSPPQHLLNPLQQQLPKSALQLGRSYPPGGGPSMASKPLPASSSQQQRRTEADMDHDDISSGGEEDDSDGEYGGDRVGVGGERVAASARGVTGITAALNTGAGRRLTYEDLQAQFGKGLKEAAANMGICATTLKRACRRHGIKRWPRRQIVKLSKALTQVGKGATSRGT